MNNYIYSLFYFDQIAIVMLVLIFFIGTIVVSFSSRYMKGDTRYRVFFFQLSLLIASIAMIACTDHLLLFFSGWCLSNYLLVKLMIHKSNWTAAKYSGLLAAKNYFIGAVCIGSALLYLYFETGEASMRALMQYDFKSFQISLALLLLMIGAMTQSAIWPFHRWLISSLNSPTPVSAIMHAGIVNGGGFLIARFAPLYLNHPHVLNLIFAIGIFTAIIGTLYKLLQNNIKQMLAFSTMGQMGFMLAQIGLGIFPAAMAHLTTHGMFKAYLFLVSGSEANEKRFTTSRPPNVFEFFISLACGLLGSYCFSVTSGKSWLTQDTSLFLTIIVFLTACQSALSIIAVQQTRLRVLFALIITSILSLIYGMLMLFFTKYLHQALPMTPQPLNKLHITAIIILIVGWLSILFSKIIAKIQVLQPLLRKGYVIALNLSQPEQKTVTPHRNYYKYL